MGKFVGAAEELEALGLSVEEEKIKGFWQLAFTDDLEFVAKGGSSGLGGMPYCYLAVSPYLSVFLSIYPAFFFSIQAFYFAIHPSIHLSIHLSMQKCIYSCIVSPSKGPAPVSH